MDNFPNSKPLQHRDAGVTLIEILVVIVLIGVSAGIVTYSLPSGPRARDLGQEAALLSARINLAAERSLINGRYYRLNWQADGYVFEQWEAGAWAVASGAPLTQFYTLERGAVLTDVNHAQRGVVLISPDFLPSENGIDTLRLEAAALSRAINFDGALAGLEAGTE